MATTVGCAWAEQRYEKLFADSGMGARAKSLRIAFRILFLRLARLIAQLNRRFAYAELSMA
jgi:hypothetical protein